MVLSGTPGPRPWLQRAPMEVVDALSLVGSRRVALGHQDRLTVIQAQDSPIEEFVVQGAKGQAIV